MAEPQPVDFKTLQLPSSPNYYLMCPENYCAATPNEISPIFKRSLVSAELAWQRIVAKQPRTQLLSRDSHEHQFFYVQRSLIFRFPDYITVQIIPLTATTTTIAIYSHSKYGYSDLGMNKKRVQSWVAELMK
ncbi:MAG: DUF1499 domain-containing protein [Gammaproteobacteria bacterium]